MSKMMKDLQMEGYENPAPKNSQPGISTGTKSSTVKNASTVTNASTGTNASTETNASTVTKSSPGTGPIVNKGFPEDFWKEYDKTKKSSVNQPAPPPKTVEKFSVLSDF